MPGTLYIVATPIGNLEDITLRALRILRECDLVACEDTRQTRKLLNHYGIAKAAVSYHEHNEAIRSGELLLALTAGKSIALVSDAGTPLIADPGYRLVERARAEGLPVVPIPGPSALISSLSASGLPTDSFRFGGFLPPKEGARRRVLEEQRDARETLIYYEAPHRIIETLADIAGIMGSRPVVIAREITKIHEEFLSGTAAELLDALRGRPPVKGEITLMIGKGSGEAAPDGRTVEEAVQELVAAGVPRMDALKTVARQRGLGKREIYRQLQRD